MEKDQMYQFGRSSWKSGNDESCNKASILGDEVVAPFADEKQRKNAETLIDGTIAVQCTLRRLVPRQFEMFNACLSPPLSPS